MAAYISLEEETLDDKPQKEKYSGFIAELGEGFVVLCSPTPTTNEKA